MTEQPVRNQIVHRWYTRPVLFVAPAPPLVAMAREGSIRNPDRVAQLVEQRTFNPQAPGSIPGPVIELQLRHLGFTS